MATYLIGDLQGCLEPLQRLLDHCRFDPAADHAVFAGDLVARGPDSLGTLRFVRGLGAAATTVLGNHDLNLLAVAQGLRKPKDGLDAIMAAPDCAELIEFVARQPLAWHDAASRTLVVHAGLAPQWTVPLALELAAEVQAMLRDPRLRTEFLPQMYGNEPTAWQPTLAGAERLRFTINCLTRARYCTPQGAFEYAEKGPPGSQPAGLVPWFMADGRQHLDHEIVFGHWSSLGQIAWPGQRVWGLDSGCIWGGPLTALRLEDRQLLQVPGNPRAS
ncbi:MAG TPA: symmetrical bis(5'-nucleosyl)-tetraphosphatase [Fontimonas sp.]